MNYLKRPWKHDPRSKKFSHHKLFGTVPQATLPETLGRPRQHVFNQGMTLRCTGYGSAANGSYIHGRAFSPDWSAYKIGVKQGKSVDEGGGDPNATMKHQRDDGFLPLEDAPYSLERNGAQGSGMYAGWPAELDEKAKKFDTVPGFVRVDGPYDTFDNIRVALHLACDPVTKFGATVDAFGRWFAEWSSAPRGIVPSTYKSFIGYHRYIFIDWVTIDGKEYLVAHNSGGTGIGDGGFFYFDRDTVNREFSQWGTTLKIVKTLTPEQIAEAKKETTLGRAWRALIDLWYVISLIFGRV